MQKLYALLRGEPLMGLAPSIVRNNGEVAGTGAPTPSGF
jgi:hypothetical protein